MFDSATPWPVAPQAPLSMGFSRPEYWSGLPRPPPDLPDPGIVPESLMSPALAGGFFTTRATWEVINSTIYIKYVTNKNPLYSTGNCAQHSAVAHMGKDLMKNGYVYLYNRFTLLYA